VDYLVTRSYHTELTIGCVEGGKQLALHLSCRSAKCLAYTVKSFYKKLGNFLQYLICPKNTTNVFHYFAEDPIGLIPKFIKVHTFFTRMINSKIVQILITNALLLPYECIHKNGIAQTVL